jgi:hypothetical protein
MFLPCTLSSRADDQLPAPVQEKHLPSAKEETLYSGKN